MAGKVAVVTGGASGIGLATVRLLAYHGATVYCADLHGAADAVTTIGAPDGNVIAALLDVADKAAVDAFFAEVLAAHKRLDGLVTSAGIMSDASIADLDEPALDRVLAVNLKGTLWCCQAAATAMGAQRCGSIVTLSSAAADQGAARTGAYAMSKGAVVQLTRVLAREMADRRVRVNGISPGVIMTRITERHFTRPDGAIDETRRTQAIARLSEVAPMNRIGDPAEIAEAALFLLSDASSYVTGQILRVNGGLFMA